MGLTYKRSVLSRIEGIYCVEIFWTVSGPQVVAASELHGGICKSIDFQTKKEETVWTGPGGCMNVAQWNARGDIIGVQNFYKGAQALDAQIAAATRINRRWETRVLAKLPYLHHCGIIHVGEDTYVVASTLCTRRDFPGDWNHPGRIQVIKITEPGTDTEVQVIKEGVSKNHGFWQGRLDGKEVILISGDTLYQVQPPSSGEERWKVDALIRREISDIAVVDIDGDGEDEILAYEGLHGNLATINKRIHGVWEIVYSCPMEFAHGIWGGHLLGKPVFVTGSMQGEGELAILMYDSGGDGFAVRRTVLEKGIGPSNIRGFSHGGKDYILAAAREAGELVMFELSEEGDGYGTD